VNKYLQVILKVC